MEKTKIRVVNKSKNPLPKYETDLSAGMDLRADFDNGVESVTIKPLQRELIKTNLFIELPEGYEGQIRPRSGLALKHGVTVLNTPGTLDSDYRGNLGIILINLSDVPFEIHQGDRVAQMVIAKHERAELENVLLLNETKRGKKGFGSTNIK